MSWYLSLSGEAGGALLSALWSWSFTGEAAGADQEPENPGERLQEAQEEPEEGGPGEQVQLPEDPPVDQVFPRETDETSAIEWNPVQSSVILCNRV